MHRTELNFQKKRLLATENRIGQFEDLSLKICNAQKGRKKKGF